MFLVTACEKWFGESHHTTRLEQPQKFIKRKGGFCHVRKQRASSSRRAPAGNATKIFSNHAWRGSFVDIEFDHT
jgi:hypothetical protein